MALNSTRVEDGATGIRYGSRLLEEQDGSGNDLNAQYVDLAGKQWDVSYASPTRLITGTGEDAANLGTDFASVTADMLSNKLTVLDQNLLVASIHVGIPSAASLVGDAFSIVPFIIDSGSNILGYLEPKSATPWATTGGTPIQYATGTVNFYIVPLMSWPLNGAGPYIGIGVYGDLDQGEGSYATIKVFADLVTGVQGSGFADNAPSTFYGKYGFTFG